MIDSNNYSAIYYCTFISVYNSQTPTAVHRKTDDDHAEYEFKWARKGVVGRGGGERY